MQRLEVSGAVRHIYESLGVKRLIMNTGRVEDYSRLVSEEKKIVCFKAHKLYRHYKYVMGFANQLQTPTMICVTVTALFFRA